MKSGFSYLRFSNCEEDEIHEQMGLKFRNEPPLITSYSSSVVRYLEARRDLYHKNEETFSINIYSCPFIDRNIRHTLIVLILIKRIVC